MASQSDQSTVGVKNRKPWVRIGPLFLMIPSLVQTYPISLYLIGGLLLTSLACGAAILLAIHCEQHPGGRTLADNRLPNHSPNSNSVKAGS